MPVKLVLADIDGCISPEESRAWDGCAFEEFARVSRAAAAGNSRMAPVTLCTGRPQPYVEALMKILDIRYPAICEGGAVFYSLHDNRSYFAPGISREMVQGLQRLRSAIIETLFPRYPQLVYQFGKEAQISLYSEDPRCFPEIIPQVHRLAVSIPGLQISVSPSHYYLNIDLAGVSKGLAIKRLLEQLSLTGDEAAGIGDTAGDISIRENVSFFACPANAVPIIRERADYVSPYPDIQGVLDILRRPELNARTTP